MTVIAAQELQRYGVTVNCLAPNARTRMTEATFGEIPKPEDGFDTMDPANMAPIVVALCADEAQAITGQCFFVYGGAVNVLRPWDAGEVFARTRGGTRMSCSTSSATGSRRAPRPRAWRH